MPEQKPDKQRPEKLSEWKEELPLIPLRNMVVFPQMIVPLFIGRNKSVKALEGTLTKEIQVDKVEQEKGEFSWGTSVEKVYYSLGKNADPKGQDKVKEFLRKWKK